MQKTLTKQHFLIELLVHLNDIKDINLVNISRILGVKESELNTILTTHAQQDLYDPDKDTLQSSNINVEKQAQELFDRIVKIAIRQSKNQQAKKQLILSQTIEKHISLHYVNKKEFSAKMDCTPFDISRLLRDLKAGQFESEKTKNKPNQLLIKINNDISEKQQKSEIDEIEFITYLQNKRYSHGFTEQQKNNICGDYICIKRSSMDVNEGGQRELVISTIRVDIKSSRLHFSSYDYFTDYNPTYIEGYMVRDTNNSIFLICTTNINITADLSANEEKINKGENIFFNGSFSTKNQNHKPYSTWCHISKISPVKSNIKIDTLKENTLNNNEGFFLFRVLVKQFLDGELYKKIEPYINSNYDEHDDIFDKRLVEKLCLNLESDNRNKRKASADYILRYL